MLSDEEKEDILLNTKMIPAKRPGAIYTFFFDVEGTSYEAVFTTISIVSALLLTIPFNAAQLFNENFFESFISAVATCPPDKGWGKDFNNTKAQHHLFDGINSVATNSFFSSLLGISLSTVYFVLKPNDLGMLSKWNKRKLKLLALIGSLNLLINIVFVMLIGIHTVSFIMIPLSFCGDSSVSWAFGIVAFLVMLAFSIYLVA